MDGTHFRPNFYPPALTSGNPLGMTVPRGILYFYPPALTSGNRESQRVQGDKGFLSTRSHERELKTIGIRGIIANFYPPALTSGNYTVSQCGSDHLFLSTRSHERERNVGFKPRLLFISIHPLSRAGTNPVYRLYNPSNFYPPALTSGNFVGSFLHGIGYFYPPALTSGNSPARISFVAYTVFLSTRSHERELRGIDRRCLSCISIHPLSRAGTPVRGLSCRRSVFLSTRSHEREPGRLMMTLIFAYFYPPALTSGNSLFTSTLEFLVFLSTRSHERELSRFRD